MSGNNEFIYTICFHNTQLKDVDAENKKQNSFSAGSPKLPEVVSCHYGYKVPTMLLIIFNVLI